MENSKLNGAKDNFNVINENNSDFNNKIIHYKEFLLNLEKEFANNNDKLKKISSLKDQINEISEDFKTLNSLEEQQGKNNPSSISSQNKSVNNLSLIVSTLEKNYLKKQKIIDKIISKMSRKIKDILIFNKEINLMKNKLQKSKNEQKILDQKIKEINSEFPSLNTDINMNKHKYSELLEESQKMKKENFVLNEKMYEEIIDYGNKIKVLEGRKEKLKKVRDEQMENLKKEEKIKNLEKEKSELKKQIKIIEEENDEYVKLINEFLTHLNLNYINLINLKQLIGPINQNEINVENYILNKNEQCQIIENQIENIINKYY